MKNVLLLLCTIILITTTSCRKSYHCGCYNSQPPNIGVSYEIKAASSFEADLSCFGHNNDTLTCSVQ